MYAYDINFFHELELIVFGTWQFSFSITGLLFLVDVPYPLMSPTNLPLGLFGEGSGNLL